MEEHKGFEIKDKRSRTQAEAPPAGPSCAPSTPKTPETLSEHPSGGKRAEGRLPPITFTSFILSLAASGLIHLGCEANPKNGEKTVDLEMARQSIDLLSLLQEKTKGNLTSEEEAHLSQTLFALRMTFVELDKKSPDR